jgi:hypothetical protein
VRVVPTRQVLLGADSPAQPPAELFVPVQREAPDREPAPAELAPSAAGQDTAGQDTAGQDTAGQDTAGQDTVQPSGVRPGRVRAVAIMAVLLAALLGVVTIATFPGPAPVPPQEVTSREVTSREIPPAAPDQPADSTDGDATDGVGIAVLDVPLGTSVTLPGPVSRDWVAPGASSDGALVRADLDEESIEFRAANTQPGRPGAFRLSWSGGDATTILGVRPGGWVDFVIRPLSSPADLVLHLSGNDVGVMVDSEDGPTRKILSSSAAAVTVALPAATAITVRVAPAGDQEIAVASAELQ